MLTLVTWPKDCHRILRLLPGEIEDKCSPSLFYYKTLRRREGLP